MANNQADVAVVVSGDTSQLRTDLSKGARALESFEDKAKKMQSRLLKVTAATIGAGAALTTALYKNQSQVIDSLAKTADALGVTTENLQALRHMGELAGVASADLDKAIQRMSKGLGDAARKGGAAAEALDDVGVNIKDVLKLSADKQMEVLAKALANVDTHIEKASIASDIFGRNGLRMLKVLNQLEDEGLKPTIDSIDAMGASLNRIDAAKVEDANDAVAKAQEAASGLAKELTVTLAPVVENIANAFTDWVKESGGLRNKLEELKPVINAMVNVGKAMIVVFGAQMVGAFAAYVIGVGKAIVSNAMLVKSMGATAVAGKALRAVLATLGGPIGILATVVASFLMFRTEAEDLTPVIEKVKEANYDLTQSFKDLSLVQSASHIIDLEKAMESLQDKIKKTREGMDMMRESGGAMIPNDAFQFDTSDLWSDEVFTKATASLEQLESKYSAMNSRLGKLGMQASGALFLNDAEIAEESAKADIAISQAEMKYKGYFERRAEAQKKANLSLIEDHKITLETQERLDQMDQQRKRDFVSGTSKMFGDLSSLMGSENKRLFQIGKAAAIAQASIDGISAAVSSYKFGAGIGGPILGASFAAASTVATGAMISQISSQQFGGGGKVASAPSAALPQPQQGGANTGQTLTVEGLSSDALITGDRVADIAEKLLDFQREGGKVYLGA